jgi:citrate lyase subunit beta/citryl-CoA lyase
MLEKAAGSAADEVFLDLEDAVAPSEKERARELVVEAVRGQDWGDKVVVVRVNACDTHWCHADLVRVAEGAGDRLDCVMVPKVESARDLHFVHTLLEQVELGAGRRRPIGIEAQIESGAGVFWMREIALASPRLETLIFGPGDYSANVGMPSLSLGAPVEGYPGDHWHHVLSTIVNAARAVGAQPIDGPYGQFRDLGGLREMSRRSRALGFDGKWAIHPSQIEVINEVFSPSREEYERAEALLAAYRTATEEGRGAAMHDGEMIDEASRKMAERISAQGRAAGLDSAE